MLRRGTFDRRFFATTLTLLFAALTVPAAGVARPDDSHDAPVRAIIWGGGIFTERADFEAWLDEHNVDYEAWAARHVTAADALEAGRDEGSASALIPNVNRVLVAIAVGCLALVLAVVLVARFTVRVRDSELAARLTLNRVPLVVGAAHLLAVAAVATVITR